MSNGDDDDIIICFGVGPVIRHDTIKIPHYKEGITTTAWRKPKKMSKAKARDVTEQIEKHMRKIQKIIAKATGGEPYDAPGY